MKTTYLIINLNSKDNSIYVSVYRRY